MVLAKDAGKAFRAVFAPNPSSPHPRLEIGSGSLRLPTFQLYAVDLPDREVGKKHIQIVSQPQSTQNADKGIE